MGELRQGPEGVDFDIEAVGGHKPRERSLGAPAGGRGSEDDTANDADEDGHDQPGLPAMAQLSAQ